MAALPVLPVIVQENWAQCENPNCNKWRKLPPGYQVKEDEPWYCYLNPDDHKAACSASEDVSLWRRCWAAIVCPHPHANALKLLGPQRLCLAPRYHRWVQPSSHAWQLPSRAARRCTCQHACTPLLALLAPSCCRSTMRLWRSRCRWPPPTWRRQSTTARSGSAWPPASAPPLAAQQRRLAAAGAGGAAEGRPCCNWDCLPAITLAMPSPRVCSPLIPRRTRMLHRMHRAGGAGAAGAAGRRCRAAVAPAAAPPAWILTTTSASAAPAAA